MKQMIIWNQLQHNIAKFDSSAQLGRPGTDGHGHYWEQQAQTENSSSQPARVNVAQTN